MRSLFVKIFFSFWLSTVLIVSLSVLTSERPRFDQAHQAWRSMVGRAVAMDSYEVVKLYNEQGCANVPQYLTALNKSTNVRAFLFDGGGALLCSSRAPAEGRELAKRALQSGEIEFLSLNDERLVAQPTVASGGAHYVLVAEMPRPVPPFRPFESTKHLLIAVSISGLVCFVLARYLTAPIARLRTAAQQIAGGNLSARAADGHSGRRDEVADLVHDFDSMAARLESLIHAQNPLISNVSHELRSPLARLSLALGLARQNASDTAAAPLDRIEREAERLNEMIERLLTLARLQAPREKPANTSFQLADLVREAVEDADFEARSRNSEVRFQPAGDCTILGNPDVLRSAVENVLRNSVRYTREGTAVEVTLACTSSSSKKAVITVRDHGPGVPDDELPNLFRPFYRLDQSRERETGGVGLGLAIAEQAVKLHEGTIAAKNASGGGLLIEISIPVNES